MNTIQVIQLAGTAVFAISAIVVGQQAHRYAQQAEAAADRAEAAHTAIRDTLHADHEDTPQ